MPLLKSRPSGFMGRRERSLNPRSSNPTSIGDYRSSGLGLQQYNQDLLTGQADYFREKASDARGLEQRLRPFSERMALGQAELAEDRFNYQRHRDPQQGYQTPLQQAQEQAAMRELQRSGNQNNNNWERRQWQEEMRLQRAEQRDRRRGREARQEFDERRLDALMGML